MKPPVFIMSYQSGNAATFKTIAYHGSTRGQVGKEVLEKERASRQQVQVNEEVEPKKLMKVSVTLPTSILGCCKQSHFRWNHSHRRQSSPLHPCGSYDFFMDSHPNLWNALRALWQTLQRRALV